MDSQNLETLLSHPGLADRAKVVLVVLSQRTTATAAQIARAAGHSLRKVQLALRELIQHGLVETHYQSRQVWYSLKAERGKSTRSGPAMAMVVETAQCFGLGREVCGQLISECGKFANDLAINERSFADRTPFRERSFANHPPSNARARTSQSSSSEEDLEGYPVPSPPEGGAGGNSKVIHIPYLAQMKAAWRQIAPTAASCPEGWFHKLYQGFGAEIPLAVLRQFALSERTLQDLKHPENYKSYFTRCCYTEQAKRQSTAVPDNTNTGEEDEQAPDLLTVYLHRRRNRPCAAL